jgi:hypothetical protein
LALHEQDSSFVELISRKHSFLPFHEIPKIPKLALRIQTFVVNLDSDLDPGMTKKKKYSLKLNYKFFIKDASVL